MITIEMVKILISLSITDGDNVSITVNQTIETFGIALTDADGGVIKLTDDGVTNAGLNKLGLEGQSEESVFISWCECLYLQVLPSIK